MATLASNPKRSSSSSKEYRCNGGPSDTCGSGLVVYSAQY